MKKIPYYEIKMSENTLLEYVSLVAEPAIMEMGLAFSNEQPMKFVENKDKRVIVGPAMIPGLPLYRNTKEMGEFYVVFTAEVIEQLFEKFSKLNKAFKVNVDHSRVVESAFIKSAWIIEDAVHDKSLMFGFNYPVGTLMMEVKVDDEAFWNQEVKTDGKSGFSVEGDFELEFIGEFNKSKTKTNLKMTDVTKLIEGLSPEELDALKALLTPVEAVVEVEEEMAVEEVPVEAVVEEAVVEVETPEAEAAMDEAAVLAIVEPKFEEFMAMLAELNSKIEGMNIEKEKPSGDTPAAFSSLERLQKMRAKFSQE
jgi:hypothetical protein